MSDSDAVPSAIEHVYVSTYCLHGLCSDCRQTCKICKAPCQHICHWKDGERKDAMVDIPYGPDRPAHIRQLMRLAGNQDYVVMATGSGMRVPVWLANKYLREFKERGTER